MAATLWKIGRETVDVGERALIMGVLNVTPDSFSNPGEHADLDVALTAGLQMAGDGADIIDVGGESTRPGAEPVLEIEELQRVVPVVSRLSARAEAVISIDTTKAEVARAALDAGASIINDISGGRFDDRMLPLAAERGCGFIIMHMQGTPQTMQKAPRYDDVVAEVREFFRQQYARAIECGLEPAAIAFDPGIGFGKTLEHNLALLRKLPRLRMEDRPLVVGVSRKSFLARMIGAASISDRIAPTIALTALLRGQGANVLRVHDVKPNVEALRVTEAFIRTAK